MGEKFTNNPRAVGTLAEMLDRLRAAQRPCERKGKHKHLSLGAALAHLRSIRRRYDDSTRQGVDPTPYLCSCGWWHTGRRRDAEVP